GRLSDCCEIQGDRRRSEALVDHRSKWNPRANPRRVLQGGARPKAHQAHAQRLHAGEQPEGIDAAMKYAICNETFEGWDHARVCTRIAELGYTGLEMAPFTLASRITDVTAARRAELRRQAESASVKIIGLHWLLAKTEGFHLTSHDA